MEGPAHLLVAFSVRHPSLVLAVALGMTALVVPGVASLRVETATESVLDRGSPGWEAYESYLQDFGADEYVAFLVDGKGSPLDDTDLREVRHLSEELQSLDGVDRVESLSTISALTVDGSGRLIVGPLLDHTIDRAELARRIDRHRTAENWIISVDRSAYGVNAIVEVPVEESYAAILDAAAASSTRDDLAVSGVPIFRAAADERMRKDLSMYVPITASVVCFLMLILFGSLRSAVVALVAPGFSVLVTLGAMGYIDVPLSITTVVIPPIVLALGCAYAMHVLCALGDSANEEVLIERLSGVASAVGLSGLTTAIGFLGLAAIRIDAINTLGVFGALAVALLTLGTLSLAPAVVFLLGVRVDRRFWNRAVLGLATGLWRRAEKSPAAFIVAWSLVIVLGALGATQIRVSTNVIEWFRADESIRLQYEAVRSKLAGITPLAVVLEAGSNSAGVTGPMELEQMRSFLVEARAWESVGHAISVADILDQLYAEIRQVEAGKMRSEAEAEELLLLIDGNPALRPLLSRDRRAAAVLMRLDTNDSDSIQRIAAEAERWWSERQGAGLSASATGVMMEFAIAQDEIVTGQLRGLGIALASIALVIAVAFRSLYLASICLVVNCLPLLVATGLMWLFDVAMDAATAVIACLTLGIAVDDSLHLISQRERWLRLGVKPSEAGTRALGLVGQPVVLSTIAITSGFIVLGGSGFLPVANLGWVTAGTVFTCMVADLSLMPALLMLRR